MTARRVVAYGLATAITPTLALALVLGALCASQADRTEQGIHQPKHRRIP